MHDHCMKTWNIVTTVFENAQKIVKVTPSQAIDTDYIAIVYAHQR